MSGSAEGRAQARTPAGQAAESPAPAACVNCGAPLHGRYCHQCGQDARAVLLDVREFVSEGVQEILNVDRKVLRSVRLLLFSPGTLTAEFIAGKRARYVSPLRLYLVSSVLFFALAGLFGPTGRFALNPISPTAEQPERETAPPARQASSPLDRALPLLRKPGWIEETIQEWVPRALFLLLPLFALMLRLAYRRSTPHYTAHLYFGLHLHAFAFVLLSLSLLLRCLIRYTAGPPQSALGIHLRHDHWLLLVPYFVLASRRVYGGAWWPAVWKSQLVLLGYALALAGAVMATILAVARIAAG